MALKPMQNEHMLACEVPIANNLEDCGKIVDTCRHTTKSIV